MRSKDPDAHHDLNCDIKLSKLRLQDVCNIVFCETNYAAKAPTDTVDACLLRCAKSLTVH